MRRVLSRIGIGAATVDTVLPAGELRPGETVTVDVELYGGNSTQDIEGIYLVLTARAASDGAHELAEFVVERRLTLDPGEERTIQADVEVPLWTPITVGGVSVRLETRLDVDWSRDPTDEDGVEVVPDDAVAALFDALDEMGFGLRGSELDEVPHVEDRPLAQRFRFEPTGGPYEAELDSIEVTPMPRGDDIRVFVEFDRAGTIADEHGLDFDKQEVSMTFDRASVPAIRRRLEAGIERNA